MIKKTGRKANEDRKNVYNKIIIKDGVENIQAFMDELASVKKPNILNLKWDKKKNWISFVILCHIDEHCSFIHKCASAAHKLGIKFSAVFKDSRNTLGWCGYYEMSDDGNIYGSKYHNKVKIDTMCKEYFKKLA